MMINIAGGILAVALLWAVSRWRRPRAGHTELGAMSQSWIAEQRLARSSDPQR